MRWPGSDCPRCAALSREVDAEAASARGHARSRLAAEERAAEWRAEADALRERALVAEARCAPLAAAVLVLLADCAVEFRSGPRQLRDREFLALAKEVV